MTMLGEYTDRRHRMSDKPGRRALRRLSRRALTDSLYTLSAFPIAVAGLVITVVLIAVGLSLAVVVGGLLLLGAATRVARWFAQLERTRLRALRARPSSPPVYRPAEDAAGYWSRALAPLLDPQSWRDIAWSLFGVLSATAAGAVTLAWWAVAGSGLTYWLWQFFVPVDTNAGTLASVIGLGEGRLQESVVNLLIGALALASLPFAVRLAASAHATVASALLGGAPTSAPADQR